MKFDTLYKILVEMPLQLDPIEIEDKRPTYGFNRFNNYQFITDFIVGNTKLGIYQHTSTLRSKDKVYSIVYNDNIIATYSGKEIKQGITTVMVKSYAKKYNIKMVMYNFYVEFLLKKYEYILSDDSLTNAGFNFWLNNFDNFNNLGYKISIVRYDVVSQNINIVEEVNNKEKLKQYYGKIIDNPTAGMFRFLLSK